VAEAVFSAIQFSNSNADTLNGIQSQRGGKKDEY
jgi:hypothetical protein